MDSNTQTAPVATPAVPPAQPTAEELAAKVAELERQSEGRLRDLQEERRKRQELEQKYAPQPVPPAEVKPEGVNDELAKVLNPYLAPVEARAKRAEAYMAQVQQDKAMEFLSTKTGKSKDDVLADADLDNRLTAITRKYKLTGDVYDVTVRAWEILELENLRNQDAERRRQEIVANQGNSIPGGTHSPSRTASKVYSEEEFSAMNPYAYEELANKGTFTQKKNGDIEYTPHSK